MGVGLAARTGAMVARLARRYGCLVAVGEVQFWAFLLPPGGSGSGSGRAGRWEGELTPTGRLEPDRWTYWGPATGGGESLEDGMVLQALGRSFAVGSLRDCLVSGQVVARGGALIPLDDERGRNGI